MLLKGTREKVPGFAEQLLLEMFGDYISIGKKGQKKVQLHRDGVYGVFFPFQRSSDNTVIVNIRVVNSL